METKTIVLLVIAGSIVLFALYSLFRQMTGSDLMFLGMIIISVMGLGLMIWHMRRDWTGENVMDR